MQRNSREVAQSARQSSIEISGYLYCCKPIGRMLRTIAISSYSYHKVYSSFCSLISYILDYAGTLLFQPRKNTCSHYLCNLSTGKKEHVNITISWTRHRFAMNKATWKALSGIFYFLWWCDFALVCGWFLEAHAFRWTKIFAVSSTELRVEWNHSKKATGQSFSFDGVKISGDRLNLEANQPKVSFINAL